jgi:hypothetical protein
VERWYAERVQHLGVVLLSSGGRGRLTGLTIGIDQESPRSVPERVDIHASAGCVDGRSVVPTG